ncbi:MAG: AraC family ligand binding domain-containing protein [Chloroflexi bacterium]|nr:AraC family ligand binding domain-containing protein [Chloroflexota bacterium]
MPKIHHHPTGPHPEPASVHYLDLEAEADRLTATLAGHRRRSVNLARESGVSLIMMALEAGDAIAEHSAEGVVVVQLLRGHAVIQSGGESYDLRDAQAVLFQPGVRHTIHAEEQSVVLLTVNGEHG